MLGFLKCLFCFLTKCKLILKKKNLVKMYYKQSDIRLEDAACYISLCLALARRSVLTIPFNCGSKFSSLNMLGFKKKNSIWDTLNLSVCLDTMYGCYVPLPPLILFGNVCNFFLALVGPFWLFKELLKLFCFVSWANVPFLTRANVPFFFGKSVTKWAFNLSISLAEILCLLAVL